MRNIRSLIYLASEIEAARRRTFNGEGRVPSGRLLPSLIISPPPLYSSIRLVRRPPMDRMNTYVEGFDEALGGGIPRGSLVLVGGTPGTMKPALTLRSLYRTGTS